MSTTLPTRPNIDHLREQAKDLLSDFKAGKAEAIAEFQQFLPSLTALPAENAADAKVSLSDAQSAIARKHGFPSWPRMVKHVEALRAIDGTWHFTSLEIEGSVLPESAYESAQMTIDGDRFKMVSPETTHEGFCSIDVEAVPNAIDIQFTGGPEKGNRSLGIYEFDGRELRICLGLTGTLRPAEFVTTPGSGHALETLRRGTAADPQEPAEPRPDFEPTPEMLTGFGEVTPEMEPLQGKWAAVSLKRNGVDAPMHHYGSAMRDVSGAKCDVSVGGQVFIQALMKLDTSQDPAAIDYLHTAGANEGKLQLGIMAWEGDLLRLCFADPGFFRPTNFDAEAGSGRTSSVWRQAKEA